jgi:hypothetical protein
MTKEQTIERFCKLSEQVASSQKFNWMHPADCFCTNRCNGFNFQFSEEIMYFIEKAVQKELNN